MSNGNSRWKSQRSHKKHGLHVMSIPIIWVHCFEFEVTLALCNSKVNQIEMTRLKSRHIPSNNTILSDVGRTKSLRHLAPAYEAVRYWPAIRLLASQWYTTGAKNKTSLTICHDSCYHGTGMTPELCLFDEHIHHPKYPKCQLHMLNAFDIISPIGRHHWPASEIIRHDKYPISTLPCNMCFLFNR